LLREWPDGRIKLATTALLLALRRKDPDLFADGDYQPVSIEGDASDCVFGYVRSCGSRRLAVLLARFPLRREAEPASGAVARLAAGPWFDVFQGREAFPGEPVGAWLHTLPFAIFAQ
jgi:(1->4)-alpha-D-glucan 1-alpha-D-glucosylmutase